MNKLQSYFETNWSAILTVIVFLLMLGMYIWVLRPKNKDKLEAHRNLPLNDDAERNSEKKDG